MGTASGQIVRVLLVSAREEAREEVAAALEERSRDYRLYWVAQAEVALARAQDLVPHVIIIDDDLGGTSAVSLIGSLAQRVPGAALIALVSPGAVGKANHAVLAGARGFLVKPLQGDELMATIRFVLTQGRVSRPTAGSMDESGQGKTLVFCAPKGGTGRTTTAINTAYWLEKLADKPVAMVDADYASPALDVALNLHSDRSILDLLPRIARLDTDLVDSVLEEHSSGLKVLLAPSPGTLDAEITLPQVQQILAQMQHMFSWVVVDLGLPLDETAFAFLDGADHIIMTVLPEMVGLRNTTLMLDQLRARGYPDDRVWLVVNRSSLRGGITCDDIERHLHIRVKHMIPDDQPLATYAINRGVPFSLSHPNAAVTKATRGLAELLISAARISDENEQEDAAADQRPAPKARSRWPWSKRAKRS